MKEIFISKHNEDVVFEKCFRNKIPLMLKGPTGCGKSQLVLYMSQKLEVPLYSVACNEDTNASDLIGRYVLKGGETVWVDGPVTKAVKEGGILYLDEVAEAREDVIVAIHPLTDHRRELNIDKLSLNIKAHDRFMLVASYNPGYQRGIKQLKASTKQRFVTLAMTYLEPKEERNLLVSITNVPSKTASDLIKIANQLRSMNELQLSETVSTRLLIRAAQLIVEGLSPRESCHYAIAETLSEDRQVVEALKDIINLSI